MKYPMPVLLCLVCAGAQAQEVKPLEATTASGEAVLLHANGRWEFVDRAKADEARKIADRYPENRLRRADAQGGLFGIGREVLPGDQDYNRGSLNPKLR